ncbi:zonadhesin-like isoform X2 [Choristoneura fumiferana]|uniref:zonadhesin-like isoform X2 n=1 Tax=Choristoneura fumiferana TaxID=7141 RepID=UPI003D15EC16
MFVLLLVLAVGAVSATTPGKPPPVPATSKSCPDPNAIRNKCASAETCRPTCEVPNAKVCPRICVIDGCECKPGYILSARGGKCVQIEECPQTNATCNGDPNAVIKANPFPCPSTCASPNALPVCTKLGPTVGCECKPGYIKSDDSGKCILPTECPGPYVQPKCGPNEYFEVCSYPCPSQNCSTLWTKYQCPEACCKPECRCKDGFLRDDKSGKCIRQDECFNPCGPLEHFVRGSSECQKTCANYMVTGPQSLCKPFTGCVCNEGRVRINDNGTGVCVPPKQCPARKCPLFEHWEACPSVCQNETCMSKNPDYKCLLPAIPLPCKPRCICDKGFLRNTFGQCIPENHCPIKKCPVNEVWRCASMCPRDSCKTLEPGFKCPPGIISVCIPACACKDGFLRNEKGRCIPKEFCPTSLRCGINEVAVDCASVIPQTCESVYTLYKPVGKVPCKPGCDCRPGYLRNKRNICVPSEFCPTVPQNQCGPNQEYKECGTACEPSCADLDNPNQICTDQCVAGCFCKDGYRKDDQGNCVTRDKCPLPVCTQPNEVATDCGSGCNDRNCDDYKRTDIVCPAVCIRGCFCAPGYVRNAYGVCIPPNQCPHKPVCLQANEEYQSCGSSCPDNCDNYLDNKRICTANCVPGCNCKAGFVRNLEDKTCVKPEQCPSKNCTGLNESLNLCASYCPVTCANRFTNGDWLCATVCRTACDCISGTLRNDSGVCVPVEQCTPPVCRQNEKYLNCGTACPLTCDNYKNPPKVCTRQCVEDCFCEDGFVRDRNMRCVKPENCEPICPAGEKFNECSAHCQDTCENFDKPDRICTYQCQSGCVCEAGTVRRKDGKCVPPLECSPQPTCSNATEVYSPCSAHCEPTCENSSPYRPCTRICKPGCKCIDGLVRRKDGQCVKVEECSQLTCSGDEVFDACSAHCEPTCENNGPNRVCTAICKPGCKCGDGLVRRKDGKCVKLKDCSAEPSCPAQEVYDPCSAHCEPTCENNGPDRACTDICSPGCKCEDGLVRRSDGKCVKLKECQNTPQCPLNERWVPCVIGLCAPKSCDELGFPVACPEIIGPCKGGCVCAENYLRNSNGVCIPQKDCPSCGGDFNATSGCGINCGNHCSNYNKPNNCSSLPLFCQYNGCDCKDGYVYNDAIKRCISPSDCPNNNQPCSDPNAERVECATQCPSTCANPIPGPCIASCKLNECVCKKGFILSERGGKCVSVDQCPKDASCNGDSNAVIKANPIPCPSTCAAPNAWPYCKKYAPEVGCECKPGFLKSTDDIDGKCIKPDECKGGNPCGVNGTFVGCNFGCPTNNCPVNDNRGVIACSPPFPCPSGCACKVNYRKKSYEDIQCILASECPQVNCTRQNEVWSPCPSACLQEDCTDVNKPPTTCNTLLLNCQPQCICKKGHYRDANGLCVPANQCPVKKQCSDPNAERVQCAPAPQCRSTCADPNPGPCIRSCAINECVCKKGYVLSEKGGKCVPIGQCPKDTPCNGDPNAVIKANPIPCPSTCAAPNAWPYCKKYAPEVGCECKPGFLKSDNNGKCIKPDECTGGNPCGVNGTFVWCNTGCPTNNCPVSDNRGIIACSPPNPCPSGCACKLNYRHKSSADITCILASDCPITSACTDPNAERVECAPAPGCRPTCDAPNPGPCILSCALNECVCKKGFILSEKGGKCIPANQCPAKPIKCKANEVYNPCSIICPPQTCASIYSSYSCPNAPKLCKPGCDCINEYLRNGTENDLCIPSSQCPAPKPACGLNEHYEINRSKCDLTCKNKDQEALIGPCQETSGCFCDDGFYRNNNGICVTKKQCPKPITCPANEVLSECYNTCHTTCKTRIRGDGRACSLACVDSGCLCKSGYLRHDNGTCVPVNECSPPACNKNEAYTSCGTACPETCLNRGGNCTTSCTKQCVEGCFCNKGFVRADDETCVKPKDCPPPTCSDPNEVFDSCPPTCPPGDNCSNLWSKFDCSKFEKCCKPGCRCKPGYYRNNGKCITTQQCIHGEDATEAPDTCQLS